MDKFETQFSDLDVRMSYMKNAAFAHVAISSLPAYPRQQGAFTKSLALWLRRPPSPVLSFRLSKASEVTSALDDSLLRINILAAYPGFLAPQCLTDDVDGS
jgi:hypothetical protein